MLDPVQQIKDRLNVVDVIGQYVKLAKAGRNYKGLSPFKKEKTASFYVSPDKGMYYDFSSNQGGDIFTFIQIMEGIDFRGALTLLADRAGIELPKESFGDKTARDRLFTLLEKATSFYETKLQEHTEAQAYLKERGLTSFTIGSFRIGFAPNSWRDLADFLQGEAYTLEEIECVGLVKRGERGGHAYDRFRSRIMFPIADVNGRVVAFSGRIFGEPAQDVKNAKYINSPETPLFNKGSVLYGFDKAKHSMRTNNFAMLVEGQMDLVLNHQLGYTNTVASSGTALTEEQLARIQHITPNLVLAYDADSAGVASTGRAASMALARGMEVKVARVPLGKDPADCIREDGESWKRAVKTATHVVPYYLAIIAEEEQDLRKRDLRIRDTVLPFIARMPSGVGQAHFVHMVADRMDIAEEYVRKDVNALTKVFAKEATQTPHGEVSTSFSPSLEAMPQRTTNRRDVLERALAGILFWQEGEKEKNPCMEGIEKRAEALGIVLAPILARYAEERETLALSSDIEYGDRKDFSDIVTDMLNGLALEMLRVESVRLQKAMKEAEHRGDETEKETCMRAFQEHVQKIEAIKKGV